MVKVIRIAGAALASLFFALSAHAATYDGAFFTPLAGGLVRLDGFGRGASSLRPDVSTFASTAAGAPFFDTWNIDVSAVAAGDYSFANMLINATGGLQFSTVTFNSIGDDGKRQTILFDLNAGATVATGSGLFTVRSSCPIQSCVWIDLGGTQPAGSTGGYSGTVVAALVPEPAAAGMMLLGLAALGALAARRPMPRLGQKHG